MKALKWCIVLVLASFSWETGGCTCTSNDAEGCDYGVQQFFAAPVVQYAQPVFFQQYAAPVVFQQQAYSAPVAFSSYGVQQFSAYSAPVAQVVVRQRVQRVVVRQNVINRRPFIRLRIGR